jgi:hypothetical protein
MRVFKHLTVVALALAALALPWPGTPAFAQGAGAQGVVCGKSQQFTLGATSITQIVAGIQGQAVHVCGVILDAGAAAATYQLTVGTGTNCNANTLNITPAWSLAANGVLVQERTLAWYSSPSGYALCHTITGTGPMNVLVLYHQF